MKPLFRLRSVPLVLLVVCLLSFGLLIPWLGFYWDDWPMILTIRLQGLRAFWDFYRTERPLSAWTLYASAPLLGTHPLGWHLYTLGIRWLTILAMWWTLGGIWPRRGQEVTWMALLFAVYPAFTQQPVSVAFSQHWLTFGLYFLSLAAMVYAVRKPGGYWPLTLLGVAAAGLHMFTMEYFAGLELLRPFILWLLLAETVPDGGKRLRELFKHWLPYLLVLAGMVISRLFFFNIPGDPNRPDLLYSLANQPLTTLLRLLQISVQDLVYNLAGVWYGTFDPQTIELTDRAVALSYLVALLTAGLIIFYLLRLQRNPEQAGSTTAGWPRQALLLGLLGAFLGSLPVWLTDRQAIYGLYSGRFALAAMFGLSILVVALLDWFTPRRLPKILLVGLLVGMAAGSHVRNATAYYRSWLQQKNFYWQLAWRAPSIQPGTALLSNDELFLYVGRAATAMVVNLLYPQTAGDRTLDYWFLELPHDIGPKQVEKLPKGKPLDPSFRIYNFNGSSLDSLVIFYKPGAGRCLWVLSPEDAANPDLPELTRLALPAANLGRISANPPQGDYPPAEIFGPEPAHTWCYYYQKADLARQLGDWRSVIQLASEAEKQGFTPANPHEALPFIEAYARMGLWDKALERTQKAVGLGVDDAPELCQVWGKIFDDAPPADAGVRGEIQAELTTLGCGSSATGE